MRVGVTTFGCDAGRSGIGRYAIQLLREFSQDPGDDRFEVRVHRAERETFLGDAAALAAVVTPGWLTHPVPDIAWHQLVLPAWCAARRLDVLFLPAGNRRLPLAVPCPAVGTVHDLSQFHVEAKYDPARMFYVKRVLPFLVRRLDHVLTVSESSRRDILEYTGIAADRVTVTPLGVDHAAFRPRKAAEIRPQLAALGVDAPFILYVARIEHPGKNHVGLIRAFDALKARTGLPHRLVLAGPDWTRADEVHRVAAGSRCAADIRFLGNLRFEALTSLYAGADLFVLPSFYEGFGLPIVESMACGVPVACSNVSSMPEVAGDAGLLFDPNDPADIATAMETVLLDRTLHANLAKRSLARAGEFTWERTARLTREVLARAAGLQGGSPDRAAGAVRKG